MKQWIKAKLAKIAILCQKVRKEAFKLSFAVVIAELVMVIVFYFLANAGILEWLKPKTIIITNEAQAKEEKQEVREYPVMDWKDKLADYIWSKESTRGKNNYSKCEAIGKVNGIGYGIPGNGVYRCFNNHEEEMEVLRGWIIDHEAQGMSEQQMLLHYTPVK